MKKTFAKTFITLTIMTLLFSGCKSQLNKPESENENCAIISILTKDTVNSSSRSASVVKPAKIDYTVTAYKTDNKGNKIDGAEPVPVFEPFEGVKLTYKLDLETGWWVFDVKGYENKRTDSAALTGDERTNVILYGNTTSPIYCNGGRYYETIYVYFTTNEKGNVNLDIDVSLVTINRLEISGTNTVLDREYLRDDNTNIININNDGLGAIASGKYNAKMDFYYNSVLLYSTYEIINITDNLVVTDWIYSGGNEYLVEKKPDAASGNDNTGDDSDDTEDDSEEASEPVQENVSSANFILTPELIVKGKNNRCWVSSAKLPVGETAPKDPSDLNSGSENSPYATLQTAFDRTMALNTEFKNAGLQQRNFTIYISGNINTSSTKISGTQTPTAASIESDLGFTLSILQETRGSSGKINGDISIGANIPTTITSISMDGLKSESKLTLSNCTLSGKSDFVIDNVSEESVITDTKIGSEDEDAGTRIASNITFNKSNVTIANNKNCPIYTTNFTADNSLLNISCNAIASSDRITVKAETFKIANYSGNSDKKILINGAVINTNNSSQDFSLENCNYLHIKTSQLTGINFNTNNLQNSTLENCQITSTGTATINDSKLVLNNTSITGPVSIRGKENSTDKSGQVTFTGTKSKISGISTEVLNTTVEFKDSSSITSTTSINFTNTNLSMESSSINSTTASLALNGCTTALTDSTIKTKSIQIGDEAQTSAKTDSVSASNTTFTTTDALAFNSSTVNLSDSVVYGQMFVLNDDFIFHNSILNGDLGRAKNGSIPADGIDTASKVILSGNSVVNEYEVNKNQKYEGNIYLEDTAVLYVKGLPSKEASPATIANISALYPTKGEVVLVMLDSNNNPVSFDNSFIVDESTTSDGIDERFKLTSAGYYLDYATPAGDTIRKGIIKECSISIILPETGGFTIDIEENDYVSLNNQGYIVINKDDIEQAYIKAVIKDRSGAVITPTITYQLYRESVKIGSAVTSDASSDGIRVVVDKLEQEMQYTDKLTYLLQINFRDTVTGLDYYDLFFVNIVD